MQDIHNGISATQLDGAIWRKSQRSNSQGACVELARLDSATVAMRNSRDPQGTALIYPATAVRAMVSALRSGRLRLPASASKTRLPVEPAVAYQPGAHQAWGLRAGMGTPAPVPARAPIRLDWAGRLARERPGTGNSVPAGVRVRPAGWRLW